MRLPNPGFHNRVFWNVRRFCLAHQNELSPLQKRDGTLRTGFR
jgi:hypothetical protein